MNKLRIAIPSSGALYEDTQIFLDRCGLKVIRTNSRRYTAKIPTLPTVEVLFQRQSDITGKVEEGSADIGVVGLDRYYESRLENGDSRMVVKGIGFGKPRLLIAVPDSWFDVTNVSDLADLSLEYHQKGKSLRIATKYTRLVKRFLSGKGLNYFSLIPASGGIEAAPLMGYADLIADISATGITLRENQLRPLVDGTIIQSEASLIANVRLLASTPEKLSLTREFLERVEASTRARDYVRVSANMLADSQEDAAALVLKKPELSGIDGPSVSHVFGDKPGKWFNIQVVVPSENLLEAVDFLRQLGGTSITVNDASYVFRNKCKTYEELLASIKEFQAVN